MVLTIAIFLLGMNNIKAALVEGDDIYHFDFTMNHKVINNYYDSMAPKCLRHYASDINPDYTLTWNYGTDGSTYITTAHNSKNLFVWASDELYLDIIDATGTDNFVADISGLDDDDCPLKSFGYNKIAVYFESEDEIPIIDEYTLDLTEWNMDINNPNEKDKFNYQIMYLLLFVDDYNITINFNPTNYQITYQNDGVDFYEWTETGDDYPSLRLINEENLTTDQNFTITREFLQNATINDDEAAELAEELALLFSNINVIVSHNSPTTPEEDSTELTNELEDMNNTEEDSTEPDIESEDSSEKEDINPTSEPDITPKSGDTKSPIISPATGDNVILYLIMFLGSTTGIVVNYWLGKQKN